MSSALPQELVDLIVDTVHADVRYKVQRRWADILALLGTARCFSARCRKHLYHTVSVDLEITPPSDLDKTLDAASLHFVELIRHTPSLAGLVKNVCYCLYFELRDVSSITSTTAWHMLQEIASYLTCLNSVALDGCDYRQHPEGFRMYLDSTVVKAIGQIIPSCPFRKLSVENMELLPIHLVDLLTYCPDVTSLNVDEVSLAHDYMGANSAIRSAPPSKIEELVIAEADSFLCEMTRQAACRTLVASTRRLVFAGFESWSTFADDVWAPLGEFIPRLKTLEKVFFDISFCNDGDFDVRALLHAPSLCVEMYDSANLPGLSRTLMQTSTHPSKLRRVAIISHTFCLHSIAEWRELASALHQPCFVALETICITFSDQSSEGTHTLEDVSRCFVGFKAKVDVRQLKLPSVVHSYFDTFF